MKLFIDTANVGEIRAAADMGILSGVTTNPSLVAKEGRDFVEVLKEILDIVDGPISAEVVSLDADGMVREGLAYAKLHKNIVIKVNGKTVVDYTEPQGAQPGNDFTRVLDSGTFALQAHDPGSTVHFKNIRVKRLD
ncbi:MAG: DUF1080 domain-containing protein [Alicyclobacillus sp.]|nr:DUF1080 domain-containing protein [Alicyclobacillus sp.]